MDAPPNFALDPPQWLEPKWPEEKNCALPLQCLRFSQVVCLELQPIVKLPSALYFVCVQTARCCLLPQLVVGDWQLVP